MSIIRNIITMIFLWLHCCPSSPAQNTFNIVIDYNKNAEAAFGVFPRVDTTYQITGLYYNGFAKNLFTLAISSVGDSLSFKDYTVFPEQYATGYRQHIASLYSNSLLWCIKKIDELDDEQAGILKMNNATGDTLWQRLYGFPVYQDLSYAIAEDQDGNILLAGVSDGFCDGEQGDLWVLKTNSVGDTLWNRTFRKQAYAQANSIAVMPDGNLMVAGTAISSFNPLMQEISGYLLKMTPNGDLIADTLIAGEKHVTILFPANNNKYYLVGTRDSLVNDTIEPFTGYIAKIDANFNLLWRHYFFQIGGTKVCNLRELPDGSLICCGWDNNNPPLYNDYGFIAKLDSSGNLLWKHKYHYYPDTRHYLTDIKPTLDGGFIAVGDAINPEPFGTGENVWVIKVDRNGCLGADSCGLDTGIEQEVEVEETALSISLYPNPASDYLGIAITAPAAVGGTNPWRVCLYDLLGRRVLQAALDGTNGGVISIASLPAGLYVVEIGQHNDTRVLARAKVVKH